VIAYWLVIRIAIRFNRRQMGIHEILCNMITIGMINRHLVVVKWAR